MIDHSRKASEFASHWVFPAMMLASIAGTSKCNSDRIDEGLDDRVRIKSEAEQAAKVRAENRARIEALEAEIRRLKSLIPPEAP